MLTLPCSPPHPNFMLHTLLQMFPIQRYTPPPPPPTWTDRPDLKCVACHEGLWTFWAKTNNNDKQWLNPPGHASVSLALPLSVMPASWCTLPPPCLIIAVNSIRFLSLPHSYLRPMPRFRLPSSISYRNNLHSGIRILGFLWATGCNTF